MAHHGIAQRYSTLISLMQQTIDIFAVWLTMFLTTSMFQIPWLPIFTEAAVVASLLFWIFARQNQLYTSWRTESLAAEVRQLLVTWTGVVLCMLLIAYALKISDLYSRRAMVAWMVLTPMGLAVFRGALRNVLRRVRIEGRNYRRIAVAGAGVLARGLVQNIKENTWMGLKVSGVYDDSREGQGSGDSLEILGDLDQLINDVRDGLYDEVFIALPMTAAEEIKHTVEGLSNASVRVSVVPDLLTFKLVNSSPRSIGDMPIISVYDSPLDDSGYILKRIEDVFVATVCILLAALPMLLIAIAIKLTSRGPVFFRQRRYGLSGEEIWVWKFRTMTVCEDGSEIEQARSNDKRVTKLGAFLRRTSLDELPQFFNVLQGTMSVVGPRPHAVAHNEEYRASIRGYMLRHLVKPGITGWAQVNGWRGETDTLDKMQQRIEYDLYYIRNWSLQLDLFIIVMTVLKGFTSERAY
jgi:putative colanic acid biosynthesis UDP-glucose lipid carrier transferase